MRNGELLPLPTLEERLNVCRTHVSKSVEWKGEILGILEMRRHYTNYLKGLPHIKEFRTRLVTVKTLQEVLSILDEVAIHFAGQTPVLSPVQLTPDQLSSCAY
jgi:tRNA-dihydrouridine synthase